MAFLFLGFPSSFAVKSSPAGPLLTNLGILIPCAFFISPALHPLLFRIEHSTPFSSGAEIRPRQRDLSSDAAHRLYVPQRSADGSYTPRAPMEFSPNGNQVILGAGSRPVRALFNSGCPIFSDPRQPFLGHDGRTAPPFGRPRQALPPLPASTNGTLTVKAQPPVCFDGSEAPQGKVVLQ